MRLSITYNLKMAGSGSEYLLVNIYMGDGSSDGYLKNDINISFSLLMFTLYSPFKITIYCVGNLR